MDLFLSHLAASRNPRAFPSPRSGSNSRHEGEGEATDGLPQYEPQATRDARSRDRTKRSQAGGSKEEPSPLRWGFRWWRYVIVSKPNPLSGWHGGSRSARMRTRSFRTEDALRASDAELWLARVRFPKEPQCAHCACVAQARRAGVIKHVTPDTCPASGAGWKMGVPRTFQPPAPSHLRAPLRGMRGPLELVGPRPLRRRRECGRERELTR